MRTAIGISVSVSVSRENGECEETALSKTGDYGSKRVGEPNESVSACAKKKLMEEYRAAYSNTWPFILPSAFNG